MYCLFAGNPLMFSDPRVAEGVNQYLQRKAGREMHSVRIRVGFASDARCALLFRVGIASDSRRMRVTFCLLFAGAQLHGQLLVFGHLCPGPECACMVVCLFHQEGPGKACD